MENDNILKNFQNSSRLATTHVSQYLFLSHKTNTSTHYAINLSLSIQNGCSIYFKYFLTYFSLIKEILPLIMQLIFQNKLSLSNIFKKIRNDAMLKIMK